MLRVFDFKENSVIESIQRAFEKVGIEFKYSALKNTFFCRIKNI
jgi:hypothetical protein